jgi:uncharacterized membrane protein
MEVAWTGLRSVRTKDFRCMGQSSMIMFPIYGMAAVIGPVSRKLSNCSRLVRGSLYTAGIFLTEFSTGSLLKKLKMCPWDYSDSPFNYKGLIRLDFAPLWFAAGLFFEEILSEKS